MRSHILEHIESLEELAGKRWLRCDPAVYLLSAEDKKVVVAVRSGCASNDAQLAVFLFGEGAKADLRYRRRIGVLTRRLSTVILSCPLSRSVDKRRHFSISCVRHLARGETLLRANAPKSSRLEFHEALARMVYREQCWYAPSVYLALAFYHKANKRIPEARRDIARAHAAAQEAIVVSPLLEMWMTLSLPIRRSADIENQQIQIREARELLAMMARRKLTPMVAMAAARLATSVSQLLRDPTIGLRWLERSRVALQKARRFDDAVAREYHLQRLFMYDISHNYFAGVQEARNVVALSPPGTIGWFTVQSSLIHLYLKSEQYAAAAKVASIAFTQNGVRRLSSVLSGRIKLRALYAQMLLNDKSVSVASLNSVKQHILDSAVLRALFALRRSSETVSTKALLSLSKLILRNVQLRESRDYVLLGKLVAIYAEHNQNLAASKRHNRFLAYEKELNEHRWSKGDHTVIQPRLIWKATKR